MADYFAILKRAVGALPEGSREQRQAIYDKARKALLAQLQQMDPPLAPAEISKQRVSLEEAIRSVELDLSKSKDEKADDHEASGAAAVGKSASAPKTDLSAQSSEISSSKAPVVELSKAATKADASSKDGVDASAGAREEAVPRKEVKGAETSAKEGADVVASESSQSDKVVRRAGQDVLKNAVRDANALGSATSAAVKSAQETADIVGEKREGDTARIEPTLGDTVVSNSKTYRREREGGNATASAVLSADSPLGEDGQKQSQSGLLIAVLLLAGGLGISAYLLYQNKEAFLGEEPGPVAEISTDGDASGQTTDSNSEMPAKTVRTVTVTADGVSSGQSNEGAQSTQAATDGAEQSTEGADAQTGLDEGQTSEQEGQIAEPGLPVAQRSIFYEEESAGSTNGRATQGQAVWSIEGKGDAASVKIEVEVPDRSVGFSISFKKNLDPELPASHLIEVVSSHNNPDEPRIIDNIPGLILKPTEQSRGVGLAGASIRIADDMYWIALKSEPQAVKYNMELLVLRSWIDMPILYKSGRRAILTLEKGDVGDRVIKEALLEWGLIQKRQP